ncbi:MAG TPA: 7-carboxy-7-deazaguanine synthase [Candidatus Competibacteraceae bacterium]|nr:7-carboxy-7-deazaguanine synthase [Candidatus Competibacteraceae bacterium]HRZ07483.1 7-carboxy-7-deazaguanine synthase [Candidatus Competibacteraceae bacterium]HSA46071.1 7-carboxy-7-deazaguanine synthase [Candidatus Competibacteraceae bacterium]
MSYNVKEIFYTLQGEGAWTGRPAVFCRFAGCNLWSGREADRAIAVCRFCDTDFVGVDGPGGGKFTTPEMLASAVTACWPTDVTRARPYVVCTGGEPLLQLDRSLIAEFHQRGFEVAVETNGTLPPPPDLDWICVSPKAAALLRLTWGDELKLVYPQHEPEAQPERFIHLAFRHFFLQPLDSPERESHLQAALAYCLAHPQWRLSLQTHKQLGIA